MNEEKTSWRSISQQLGGPAITPIAQKRRRFVLQRRVLTVLVVAIFLAGLGFSAYYLNTHSNTFAPYAQEQNKTKLVFFSDGQLSESWFNENFAALKQKGLLSIDIAALQTTLLKNPQVLEVTVERRFPNTLKVSLRERTPIARVKLRQQGKVSVYYLSRDGQLFSSPSYTPAANLPFLAGLSVRPVGDQLPPVAGSLTLGELLDGLKEKFPDLYLQITQIDLSEWIFPVSPQTSLSLNTRSGTRLRFGTQDIALQLSRLRETLDLMNAEKQPLSQKFIDLAYADRVSVTDLHLKK